MPRTQSPGRHVVAAWHAAMAGLAFLVPGIAQASDFSVLMAALWMATAVVGFALVGLAWGLLRRERRIWVRALAWGPVLALVLTPLQLDGGNGSLDGPPLLAFVGAGVGADEAYVAGALRALAIAVPAWILGVALLLLWRRRNADQADPPGTG